MFEFCKRTIKSNLPVALRWAVVILVVGLVATFTQIGRATPVTFQFDAEVVEVNSTLPVNFPLAVNVGDGITGQVVFEPFAIESGQLLTGHEQMHQFRFLVNEALFSTSHYTLWAVDNIDIDDPNSLLGSIDGIGLGCSSDPSQNQCNPNEVFFSGVDPYLASYTLNLRGDIDSFSQSNSLADPAIWNALVETRLLTLVFEDTAGNRLVVRAGIGSFTEIPEPNTALLCITAFLIIIFSLRVAPNERGIVRCFEKSFHS